MQRSGRFSTNAVFPMGDDEPEKRGDENRFYTKMEAVEGVFEAWIGVPGCAELHPDISKRVTPRPGTDEGIDVKAELVHLRDSRWKRNEGAHDGKHAADKNGDGAVAVEETIDEIEVAATE